MRAVDAVVALGGTGRWKQLTGMGVAGASLTAAVARGELRRDHRGCYSLPGTPRGPVLETIFRAELTCLSWAEHHGLPTVRADHRVHVLVPQNRAMGEPRLRPVDDVVVHRLPVGVRGGGLAAVRHLDIASLCCDPVAHLVLIDAALAAGLVRRRDLDGLRLGGVEHRRWLLDNADASSQSMGETIARMALKAAGLTVRTQVTFEGVGRVDLLVEDSLVVEIDGLAFHDGQEAFARDRQRDRALALRGLPVLRFTHEEARRESEALVQEVVAALWRHGAASPKFRTKTSYDTPGIWDKTG